MINVYKKNKRLKKEIKDFINELEHNIQVDRSVDTKLISGVACDYVINRLKDIIK